MTVIDITSIGKFRESPSEAELKIPLTGEEAFDLYSFLRYYDWRSVRNAVANLYQRDATPLYDHWENEDSFYFVYHLFKKLARSMNEKAFTSLVRSELIPDPELAVLSREERELLSENRIFRREARSLLKFFKSMNDFFEYEILLISLGYPCSSVA